MTTTSSATEIRPPWADTPAAVASDMRATALTHATDLFRAGRFDEAETAFRAMVRGDDDAPTLFFVAVCLVRRERFGEAAELLRQIVTRVPGHADSWFKLAELQLRSGNRQAAQECLDRALTAAPRHASALALRARLNEPAAPTPPATGPPWTAPRVPPPPVPPQPGPAPAGPRAPMPEAPSDSGYDTLSVLLDRRTTDPVAMASMPGELVWTGRVSLVPALARYWWFALPAVGAPIVHSLADRADHDGSSALAGFLDALHLVLSSLMWPLLLLFALVGLTAWSTTYRLHERRMDVVAGPLWRRHHVGLWLHELNVSPVFRQSLLNACLGTGAIVLDSTSLPGTLRRRRHGTQQIVHPCGDGDEMLALLGELRGRAAVERRAMVGNFISR